MVDSTHSSVSRSRQVSTGENLTSASSLLDLTIILVLCRSDQAALADNTQGWFEGEPRVGNGSTRVFQAVPLSFVLLCRADQGLSHGLIDAIHAELCIHLGGSSSRYSGISVGHSGKVFRKHWNVPPGRLMEVELATPFCHIHPHPFPHHTPSLSPVLPLFHSCIIPSPQT